MANTSPQNISYSTDTALAVFDYEEPAEQPARSTFARRSALIFAGAVIMIVFQLLLDVRPAPFMGFVAIHWQSLKGFEHGGEMPPALPGWQSALTISDFRPNQNRIYAVSEPFMLTGQELDLNLAGFIPPEAADTFVLQLKDSRGDSIAKLPLFPKNSLPAQTSPPEISPLAWKQSRYRFDKSLIGGTYTLTLTQRKKVPLTWLAVKDRADMFGAPAIGERFKAKFSDSGLILLHWLTLIAAAVWLVLIMRVVAGTDGLQSAESVTPMLGLFLAVAAGIQFRGTLFFYWDEWDGLARLKNAAFPALFVPHNEHVLPLFFAGFLSEARLFGDNYPLFILVGIVLHTFSALLLWRLLYRLGNRTVSANQAAAALAFLFLISAIHAEALNWAFEQSLIVSEIVSLGAMIGCLDFLDRRSVRGFSLALAGVVTAPLFFGNGFALPVELAAICFVRPLTEDRGLLLKRAACLLLCAGLCMLVPAYFYVANRVPASPETATGPSLSYALSTALKYLFVGAQGGAVARGVGLFPFLELEAPVDVFGQLGITAISAEVLLGWLGVLVSCVFLVIALRSPRRAHDLKLWIVGQLIIVAVLILPTIGRWNFGISQSLSLRYHYATLVGLAILVLPAAIRICTLAKRQSRLNYLLVTLLFCFLLGQLNAGATFTYFTARGAENRRYVEELRDWRNPDKRDAAKSAEKYSAENEPVFPSTLSPTEGPQAIYELLNLLDSRRYPLR